MQVLETDVINHKLRPSIALSAPRRRLIGAICGTRYIKSYWIQ